MPKIAELMGIKDMISENRSDWFYEFPNGSQIWLGGLDDKERSEKILGGEYSTIYFNEISQISYDSVLIAYTRLAEKSGLINKVYYDCNPPSPQHWAHRLFIEHIDPKTNLKVNDKLYASMLMNPIDNIENLTNGYIEETLETLPERQRRRFLLGEWVLDVEGALWNYSMIDSNRENEAPNLMRIVVSIDPAVTANENSDETGIIVVGKDEAGHGWILEDLSGRYTSRVWAEKAHYAYNKWNCDRIIGEVNNGGDLVETNVKTVNHNVSFTPVRAFKGKYLRAEPISGLYEQDKVHHVGKFSNLEEEMTQWVPSSGQRSPNRLDALVYGLTYLMLEEHALIFFG